MNNCCKILKNISLLSYTFFIFLLLFIYFVPFLIYFFSIIYNTQSNISYHHGYNKFNKKEQINFFKNK